MKALFLALMALLLLSDFSGPAYSQSTVSGTYVNKESKEYLTLYPNGTFFLKNRKSPADVQHPFEDLSGTYMVNGETITLQLSDGGTADGKIKGNVFEDSQGKPWLKQAGSGSGGKPSK